MLSLHKLKIFVTVADQGSFNKAANQLRLSQSGVSQHIRDLEAGLAADLFVRSPQGVERTNAGDILYNYSQQILNLVDEAEHEIMQVEQLHNHRLNLGTTPGISVYLLPQWLREFQNRYANLQVSLDAIKTAEVVNGVLTDRYDFGFLEGELDELDHTVLAYMDGLNLSYRVMVGSDHHWVNRQSITREELAAEPFINRQPDSRTRQWLEKTLAKFDVVLNTTTELDSPGTVKYALLNGMGAGILPEYAVMREVERGEIHLLQLDDVMLQRPLKVIWNKHKSFHAIQRSFLDVIRSITIQPA